jgi:hypothetical protein
MDADERICTFSESVANFVVDGSRNKMLFESLHRFLNFRSFRIAPPSTAGDMRNKSSHSFQTIQNFLSISFASSP